MGPCGTSEADSSRSLRAAALQSCVPSGKYFNVSGPQFPHLENGENDSAYSSCCEDQT